MGNGSSWIIREKFSPRKIYYRGKEFSFREILRRTIFLINLYIYIFFKLVLFDLRITSLQYLHQQNYINIRASNITISQLSIKLYLLTVDGTGHKINRKLDIKRCQVPNIGTSKRKKYREISYPDSYSDTKIFEMVHTNFEIYIYIYTR